MWSVSLMLLSETNSMTVFCVSIPFGLHLLVCFARLLMKTFVLSSFLPGPFMYHPPTRYRWTRRFLFPLLCLCSATRHLTLYLANWSDLLNVAFMTFYLHDFIHSWVFTVWWWQLKSRLHRESRKKERSIISACTQSKCTRIPQLHRQCNQHDSLPLCVTVNL